MMSRVLLAKPDKNRVRWSVPDLVDEESSSRNARKRGWIRLSTDLKPRHAPVSRKPYRYRVEHDCRSGGWTLEQEEQEALLARRLQ